MSDWTTKKLGELITLQRGHDLPSQDRAIGDIPIMGSSGITGYHDEAKCKGPGVVIGRSGNSMGEVSFCPVDYWPLNTCLYVTDFKGNDEPYIYYLLKTIDFDQFNSGSAQKSLNRNAVYPYEIYTTINNVEQKEIGRTLFSIEEKIHLNTQTNQTLESIAQAIFKSWFVDFDPVKAKMAVLAEGGTCEQGELAAMGAISGKSQAELSQLQQQNPEHYQQLAETAALFPSAMVESELGEIPEGWEVKYLKELTTDIKRGISPKYSEEFGTLVINQKCIRNHKIDFSLCRLNDSEKKTIKGRELKVGDVLINSTGVGTLGRLSPIRHLPEPCTFDSHVTLARADEALITPQFLAGFLIENETFIESSGAGSTGQTELNRQVIEELRLAYPDKTIISCFENIAKPISEKIAFCENEIKTLAQLRDSLLPKLLSGEIDLSDIQSEVA